MKKLSITVCTLMLSSTLFADSLTIDDAFKNGSVEGTIALYGQKVKLKEQDPANGIRNSAYGNGHLGIAYSTDSFYGFNAKVEAKGNVKLGEQHKHDWKENAPFENSALITQAYLQYELDNVISIKAGRYEGEYEWLTDYQQGAVVEILPIPDTTVSLAFSNRKAESGIDTSEDFHKPNDLNKGIYVVDIKNESLEGLEINPYYYQIPDAVKFYGLKTSYNLEHFGAIAQYAKSSLTNEYKTNNSLENGYIAHFELNGNFEDLTSAVGLIKTSKKGGADIITSYGDNISPFEDGNYVYDVDARTYYIGASYSIAGVDLGALYGVTKYSDGTDKFKEKELNLSVSYGITDSLSTSLVWVNVNADENIGDTDYNKYLAAVEYSF